MKDSINIGSSPSSEDCVQTVAPNYAERSRKELRRFIAQIRLEKGIEPFGARLFIKSNPHDFGTYYEVECEFNSDKEASMEYAFGCEAVVDRWIGYWQVVDNEMHFYTAEKDFLFKQPLSSELDALIEAYQVASREFDLVSA